jgi:hypothetical protein
VNDTYPKTNSKREPYCWIEKRKLRMIGDVFSQKAGTSNSARSARSLYLALCEIASDKQSDTYDESQPAIAVRAGLSVATVKRLLPIFGQLGLVKVKRNFINGMETSSTYTIIRGPIAHHELALAQLPKTKRATEKESLEESFEGTARKKSVLGGRSNRHSSLAEKDGEIVIDAKTGERKNKTTGEYEF